MRPGLWRQPDFVKLWAGQTVSIFGTLIGRFAFLLVAATTLNASPLEYSVLRVADMAPGIVIGLVAGRDRLRRRPIMIWADVGRFVLLLSIPAAAFAGILRIELLYVVALLVGILATFFDVSYRSYLPSLVPRDRLVEANARLQASSAVAEVAGFGLAGALVQVFTAPIAIVVDAFSFLISAVSLALIRGEEPTIDAAERPRETWTEIREGLALLGREPVLRAFAGAKATRDFFVYVWLAGLMIFLTRELALSPLEIGLMFAIGGVSSFFGATLVERITRRLGLGRTLILGFVLQTGSLVLVPLAGGPHWLTLAFVGLPQCFDAGYILFEVNETSLIQATTPSRILGRVNASMRFLGWGAMLVGSLTGGLLGEVIGIRSTMLIGGLVAVASSAWLFASPIPGIRSVPDEVAPEVSAA